MLQVLRELWKAVRFLFGLKRKEDELEEEIRFHIEELTEEWISKGMDPEKARRMALREFGGVEIFKEECRDSWGVQLVTSVGRYIRFASRGVR